MIEVKNLTKRYGDIKALDDISFTVDTGEVLGFLGPNGAGKSTTMNIITGYISSTSGTVTVDGTEILENPRETKRKIGYLPEIPPLYPEMTVRKYLEFMFLYASPTWLTDLSRTCQRATASAWASDRRCSAIRRC